MESEEETTQIFFDPSILNGASINTYSANERKKAWDPVTRIYNNP